MLSRCYPTISDLIFDLTGWYIPLPVFSYGFFVALAFLAAAYILSQELKRKEKLGLLQPFPQKISTGAGNSKIQVALSLLVWFVLGYKLIYIILHYQDFAADPQLILLSKKGNIIGGIAGILFSLWKNRNVLKKSKSSPSQKTVLVHPHQAVGDIVVVAAISGILGAKLFYLFESPGNFHAFLEDPLGSFFGGLTIYGGLIAGTIAVLWFVKKRGMKPIHIADAASPSLFVAYAVGRLGCQISGDGDWGIVNTYAKPSWLSWLPDLFWKFTYPHNIINEGVFIEGCREAHCYVLPQPVFPTPWYEIVMSLSIFLFMWGIRKGINVPGVMFSLYFLFNGIERFLIEQIRVNTKLNFMGLQVTQAEIVAVSFVIIGILGIMYCIISNKKDKIL